MLALLKQELNSLPHYSMGSWVFGCKMYSGVLLLLLTLQTNSV